MQLIKSWVVVSIFTFSKYRIVKTLGNYRKYVCTTCLSFIVRHSQISFRNSSVFPFSRLFFDMSPVMLQQRNLHQRNPRLAGGYDLGGK